MINLRHLIVDLRAHAHEVPEHIGVLMRAAATALDNCDGYVAIGGDIRLADAAIERPPFPPPPAHPVKGAPCV